MGVTQSYSGLFSTPGFLFSPVGKRGWGQKKKEKKKERKENGRREKGNRKGKEGRRNKERSEAR